MRMSLSHLRYAAIAIAASLFPFILLSAAASQGFAQTKGNIATIAGYGNLCAKATDNVGDGCPANSARLNMSYGLAVDSKGNLIIADTQHSRLRKVDAANGLISTLAGTGEAGNMSNAASATSARIGPVAVALDSKGNYYIAQNCNLPEINATTGAMTKVAGGNGCGYGGDGGPAVSAKIHPGTGAIVFDKQGNLYIADQMNNLVRRVAAGSGIIMTVAGRCIPQGNLCKAGYSGDNGPATKALLNYPTGLALDSKGNLYISDQNNFVIRKVDAKTGVITTIAGNGKQGYTGDGGKATAADLGGPGRMTFDPAGDLNFSDGSYIRKIDTAGKISTVVGNGKTGFIATSGEATGMPFLYILDLAFDAKQNLYFTDASYRAYRVDAKTRQVTAFAGDAYGCKKQTDVVGDGCPAPVAQSVQPIGLINRGGALLFADVNDPRIRRIDLGTGLMSTVLGTGMLGYTGDKQAASKATLAEPFDIAQDGAGNLFIDDQGGENIRRVDARTGIITTVAGNGLCTVQDSYGNCFSGDSGPATEAEISYAEGIASDWTGNLYIADTNNNRIRRVDAKTGIITTIAGDGNCNTSGDGGAATAAELCYPETINLDNAGNLYFPDEYNGVIRRIDAKTGIVTTVAGNPNNNPCTGAGGLAVDAGSVWAPYGLALDGANNLFFADGYCGTIGRVDAKTGILTVVAGQNDPTKRGYAGDGGPAKLAELSQNPFGIAFDDAGNLYFTDTRNRVVREIYGIAAPLVTPAPAIAPKAGSYKSPLSVTIADPITSAAIYYTTNGSTPTAKSAKYTGAITLKSSATVKAIAVANGRVASTVTQTAFTVK